MTVARASGDRIRLTTRSGRSFFCNCRWRGARGGGESSGPDRQRRKEAFFGAWDSFGVIPIYAVSLLLLYLISLRIAAWPSQGVLCYKRSMGIPYEAIGIGIAVIFGIWAFFIAETIKERVVIPALAIFVFFIRLVFPGPAGQLVSLIGWTVYGMGCIIYLRYKGMSIG